MKKTIFSLFIALSVAVLLLRFAIPPLQNVFGIKTKAGIKVSSVPDGASVFIDGEEVGRTPYQNENLKAKEYLVKLTGNSAFWQGNILLSAGTMVVVNRELAPGLASSSGEVLTLQSGQGIDVISTPNGAKVEIDGKKYGNTPLSVAYLEPGEHLFLISHDGFSPRSIRAILPKDLSLQMSIDLAVSEIDLGNNSTVDATQTPTLIVKQTPTGFLRVRDKPTTTGSEVGRANVGERLSLIEELNGWDKVRLSDGTQGYVSTLYVQKQP